MIPRKPEYIAPKNDSQTALVIALVEHIHELNQWGNLLHQQLTKSSRRSGRGKTPPAGGSGGSDPSEVIAALKDLDGVMSDPSHWQDPWREYARLATSLREPKQRDYYEVIGWIVACAVGVLFIVYAAVNG